MKQFKNCRFDLDTKEMTIEKGSVGVFPYPQIRKCRILYEDVRFAGKGEPFKHTVLIERWQPINIFEGKVLIGIYLDMQDGDNKHIYISDEPMIIRSEAFFKELEEAKAIDTFIKKIIKKYG